MDPRVKITLGRGPQNSWQICNSSMGRPAFYIQCKEEVMDCTFRVSNTGWEKDLFYSSEYWNWTWAQTNLLFNR